MDQLSLNVVENKFVHNWTVSSLAQVNIGYKRKEQARCNAQNYNLIISITVVNYKVYMILMKLYRVAPLINDSSRASSTTLHYPIF